MVDPKPCPFCGHIGVTVRQGTTFRWRTAECDNCGAQCGEVRFYATAADADERAERDVIDEWNGRAET